jgi:hypothetical protein
LKTAIAQSLPDAFIIAVLGDCARRFWTKTAAAREKKRRLPPDYPKGIEKIYVSFYQNQRAAAFLHRDCESGGGTGRRPEGESPRPAAKSAGKALY